MKIVHIGGTYVGAQKKIEYSIHNYCRTKGHESTILYAIGNTDDEQIICYEKKILNLIRRVLRKINKNPHSSFLGTVCIIHYLEKLRPDIVNLHILHHGYIDYILLLSYLAKRRIPVVFTAHDMWFFTGGCYYYTNIKCEGFQQGCKKCPKGTKEVDCSSRKTEKYLKKKLCLYSKLSSVSFVSVSPWVYSEMVKSEIGKYPQYVIMNAVGDTKYMPHDVRKSEKFTIIGVAANWDKRKGIDRFLELAEELNHICNIILVGNILDEQKNEAPSNISFVGPVTDMYKIYELYASSDLHVSMSLEETFGLTFVEAAIAGIKSMGFNSTAIPTVLEKTKGWVIHSCTVSEMSSQIKELVEHRELCALTQKEQAEIVDFFSTEKMATDYLRVYEETYNRIYSEEDTVN